MKIVFDYLDKLERLFCEKKLVGHELVFLDEKITPEKLKEIGKVDVLSVFVSTLISGDYMEHLPDLKLISARSTGYDNIDVASASRAGIKVVNVPSYGSRTVAEYAFALMLGLSRKAYSAYERLKRDGTTDVKDYEGFDLAGKTLGVVGTGGIGKHMVRLARAFDMNVLMSDMHPNQELVTQYSARYVELPDLVSQSDIVSLHVPALPSTHHLVDATLLSQFKKGSYLINTARGSIVDSRALLSFLQSGHLAGAGLDVLEGERELLDETSLLSDEHHDIKEFQELVTAQVILDMPNVIMTPHIAFNTREAKQEILEVTCNNILSFIAGSPVNVVSS